MFCIFIGAVREQSKSVLFEFDPFAKTENTIYGNLESNDLLLLKAFLETNESTSSGGSANDLREEEQQEIDDLVVKSEVPIKPPAPPRRFDSLPKNEYDEVEMVETPEKIPGKKNPALLPKLAHLASRKQPAVPPRKPMIKEKIETSTSAGSKSISDVVEEAILNSANVNRSSSFAKTSDDKKSMMQRLMKPNMRNFVKSGSKLLSRNKESVEVAVKNIDPKKLEKPKTSLGSQNPQNHRGIIFKSGVGIERAKDLVSRAAVLADQKLSFYSDKSMTTLKEVINLESVHSVHLLQDVK